MKVDESGKESLLVTAAKALGKAAGTIVSVSKRDPSAASEESETRRAGVIESPRFAKSGKSRLPRKLKKANKKKALLTAVK